MGFKVSNVQLCQFPRGFGFRVEGLGFRDPLHLIAPHDTCDLRCTGRYK